MIGTSPPRRVGPTNAVRRTALVVVAALLAATACAAEASKPVRRSAPVERDRRCDSEGAGFVYSRDTNSCIRVGGAVGVEATTGSPAWGPVR